MSDTKLDPKTLTAVVRENYPPPPPMAGWLGFYYDSDSDNGGAGWYCSGKVHADREDALCELASFLPFEGSALVEVGQAGALFGQSESEAKATRDLNRLPEPAATDVFATDRAIGVQAMNAEDVPAATEMPEAVRKVCHRLRHLAMTSAIACRIGDRDEFDEYADALECWWRNHAAQPVGHPFQAGFKPKSMRHFAEYVRDNWHYFGTDTAGLAHQFVQEMDAAQPVAVGMTPALEKVLESAELAGKHYDDWGLLSAIAAVRQQAAQVQRPKLERTRRALKCGQERLNIVFLSEETTTRWNNLFYEALAELDKWEGKP